ncbi:MAG: L-2-amino-thiazoline-4-carboxylic acid hydrolase [Oscillospiraceae bacterium]
MYREKYVPEFYIEDHAVIYALMAKYAQKECGEQGLDSVKNATIRYAKERGLRMAMRASADGEALTPNNYMAYGEWADFKKTGKAVVISVTPEYRTNSLACGWCDAWKKHDLLEYGKIYCTWIDKNLVKGFNPQNELGIDSILSFGEECCAFHWKGAKFANEGELLANRSKKAALAPRVLKDFLYHTGHIFGTMAREFYIDLGLEKGNCIINQALAEYREKFGSEKTNAMVEESKQDFLKI